MNTLDDSIARSLDKIAKLLRVFLGILGMPGAEIRIVCTATQAEMQIWLGGSCIATTAVGSTN